MTEYMLPTSPPSPRTLNPAVTPPSRATCFLPRFRIHSPAIISTTTIYFHSFNASEISEFSWREENKNLDDSISLSLSLRTEREKFSIPRNFSIFHGEKRVARIRVCSAVADQGTWRELETTVTVFLDINSYIGTTGSIPRIYLGNAPMHLEGEAGGGRRKWKTKCGIETFGLGGWEALAQVGPTTK